MAKSKCNKLEDYMRRHNLIFDGLTEVQGETREMLMKKVLDAFRQMGMKDLNEIKLENFHRLPSTKKGVPKPVIVRFCFMADRIRVWQNRKNFPKGRFCHRNFVFSKRSVAINENCS